jgi:hypothetical protein
MFLPKTAKPKLNLKHETVSGVAGNKYCENQTNSTRRFGDRILSLYSSGTYSGGPNRLS